jgi:hypothetical protein
MAAVVMVACGVGTTIEDDALVIVVERSEKRKLCMEKVGG